MNLNCIVVDFNNINEKDLKMILNLKNLIETELNDFSPIEKLNFYNEIGVERYCLDYFVVPYEIFYLYKNKNTNFDRFYLNGDKEFGEITCLTIVLHHINEVLTKYYLNKKYFQNSSRQVLENDKATNSSSYVTTASDFVCVDSEHKVEDVYLELQTVFANKLTDLKEIDYYKDIRIKYSKYRNICNECKNSNCTYILKLVLPNYDYQVVYFFVNMKKVLEKKSEMVYNGNTQKSLGSYKTVVIPYKEIKECVVS